LKAKPKKNCKRVNGIKKNNKFALLKITM